MPDLTKCTNARCVAKSDCYRFTSPPNDANQSYDIFVPDVNLRDGFSCDMMMKRDWEWRNDEYNTVSDEYYD